MNDIGLTTSPDRELFIRICDYLEKDLKMIFTTKLSGMDQSYWDFTINEHPVTLHLEHYSGISLSLSKSKPASEETVKLFYFIADLIRKKFDL